MKEGDIFKPKFTFWNAYTGAWTPLYLRYQYVLLEHFWSYDLVWQLKSVSKDDTIPIFDFFGAIICVFLNIICLFFRFVFEIHTLFVPRNISKEWRKEADFRYVVEHDVKQHSPAEY